MRVAPATVDVSVYMNIGTTGLVIASMTLFYTRTGAAQVSLGAATALALPTTAHTDNYGIEIGNGLYRVDFPDAAFAAGAAEVTLIVVDENTDVTVMGVQLDAALSVAQVAYVDSSLSGIKTSADAAARPGDAMVATGVTTGLVQRDAPDNANIALIKTAADAILADTGELQTDWANGGRLDLILDSAGGAGGLDAAATAAAVLDAVAATYNDSGSIGAKINAAGGNADPLLNAVPGAYAAGTAGYTLGMMGDGTTLRPFTSQTIGGVGLPGVTVQCYLDLARTQQHGGTQVSDATFKTYWMTETGEPYYFWQEKAGYSFTLPEVEVG